MKRVFVLVLVLMLCSVALAEIKIDDVLLDFGIYTDIFAVPELDLDSADIRTSGVKPWTAQFSCQDGSIFVYFSSDDGNTINMMLCTCSDESKILDFIAYCCSITLYLYGHQNVEPMFGNILFNYMMIRAGGDPIAYISNAGDMFRMVCEDGIYKFTAIRSA